MQYSDAQSQPHNASTLTAGGVDTVSDGLELAEHPKSHRATQTAAFRMRRPYPGVATHASGIRGCTAHGHADR
jgi:hypothetical protein